ncbi:hypothetical protein [Helicobacter canadensis]|uniref:Uncharacterized protein n=1 Tax=Helicobacter canadensis MIT 98-5491 TaxID=537970 RepID=C5ZZA6_9HELI|nr:hypothetical protein [Helicobacter canadensis]EES89364.1 conserved hypothetical protein [Helicobacter canadensis MIT 98-5491]STO99400.1 Uncharacterised protein [Helicobacter canadensis]
MHYYIYPNGGNAKYIAWIIDFMNGVFKERKDNDTYFFIDDNSPEQSLERLSAAVKEEIFQSKAKLLLSSPKNYDKLLDNCLKYGICECYDGVKISANWLNSYYREKFDCSNIIAVQLSGFSSFQKHLGSICQRLQEGGLQIVYVVSLGHYWFSEIKNDLDKRGEKYLCADAEILENLNFFPFIIEQTNIARFYTGVYSLKIVTSMEQISNRICSTKELLEVLNISFLLSSYVNIHSKSIYKEIFKLQSFNGILPSPEPRLIRGGYPSIEKEVDEFGDTIDYTIKRDTVIFISTFLNFNQPQKLSRYILKALDFGFRVIFKSCPPLEQTHKSREDDFAEAFKSYPNFIYWQNETPRLSKEELQRSITAIEIYSSMMYSYPVITKRPAILLYPNRNDTNQEILENDCFYQENLHIRIFEEDESSFIEVFVKLSEDLSYQREWEKKILDYCQNDLFNFKNASIYLSNWILKWYKKRRLLKNSL